jgi:hypothetical protein
MDIQILQTVIGLDHLLVPSDLQQVASSKDCRRNGTTYSTRNSDGDARNGALRGKRSHYLFHHGFSGHWKMRVDLLNRLELSVRATVGVAMDHSCGQHAGRTTTPQWFSNLTALGTVRVKASHMEAWVHTHGTLQGDGEVQPVVIEQVEIVHPQIFFQSAAINLPGLVQYLPRLNLTQGVETLLQAVASTYVGPAGHAPVAASEHE